MRYQGEQSKDVDFVMGNSLTNKKDSFAQDYKLQYHGYLVSPRLLMYSFGGGLMKDKSDIIETGDRHSTIKSNNRDFNFKLDFIQGSKYPFTIYKEGSAVPSWTMLPDNTFQIVQFTRREGFMGSAGLTDGINLRYDIAKQKIQAVNFAQKESQYSQIEQIKDSVLIGLNSQKENANFDLSYLYQANTDSQKDTKEYVNDAKVTFGISSKPVNFNSNIGFYVNNSNDFKNLSTNTHINYVPSQNINSSFSLYGYQVEQPDMRGNFITFFENVNYKIHDSLTLTQNLTLYKSQMNFVSDRIQSLTIGFSFIKPDAKNTIYSLNGNINGNSEQSNIRADRNTMLYSINANVFKYVESINSDISTGGTYYFFTSSRGGQTINFDINASYTGRFIQNFTIYNTVKFAEEKNTGDRVQGISTKTLARRVVSDNSLNYYLPLGYKGSLDSRVGAMFETGNKLTRTFKYGTMTYRYNFRKDFASNAGINYFVDSINDSKTLLGFVGADYKFRGVFLSLKADYWKEKVPDKKLKTRQNVFLSLSRPF